jgi:hypothetical protein
VRTRETVVSGRLRHGIESRPDRVSGLTQRFGYNERATTMKTLCCDGPTSLWGFSPSGG